MADADLRLQRRPGPGSPDTLARTFAVHPEYLKDASAGEGDVNFWDLGPELTRPARSLKALDHPAGHGKRRHERHDRPRL